MSADVMTAAKLYNASLRYLERYSSAEENLKRVLQRRVKRWEIRTKEIAPAECGTWIEIAVQKCRDLGYLNDARYAEQKIISLRRQGRSTRYIQQALQQKGISSDVLRAAMTPKDDEEAMDAEQSAAARYVQRRRLQDNDKDLAKLMRAGFSLNIARRALKK